MSIHLFCLPRKKSLNLQAEIISGIISIITPHSLIGLNCSIWIQHSSDFPGLLSWLSFHIWFFFSNIIWFVSILFSHQTVKKAGLILFDGQTVLFGEVWWQFQFCVIHCTPEVYIYCNKLSVAHQGDRFTSSEKIISCNQTLLLSTAFPGIDSVCVDDNVQPEGCCALEK